MEVTAPRPAPSALRLPAADAQVWELVTRMRRGLPLNLAEYLLVVEGLAFPTAPGVLRVVAEALAEAEADHLLVGGFAVGALAAHPRATVDIDLIVRRDQAPRFLAALTTRLGPLSVEHFKALERVQNPPLDLIISDATALRRMALDPALSQPVDLDGLELRLPLPELAIVLKYAAAVSLSRSAEDADQDLTDLRRVVAHHPDLDLDRLGRIVRTLRTRSPKEIGQIIATLRAGGGVVVTRGGSRARVVCVMP